MSRDKLRNQLEVSTVSTLLKIKSYFQDEQVIVTQEHIELYRKTIKDIENIICTWQCWIYAGFLPAGPITLQKIRQIQKECRQKPTLKIF